MAINDQRAPLLVQLVSAGRKWWRGSASLLGAASQSQPPHAGTAVLWSAFLAHFPCVGRACSRDYYLAALAERLQLSKRIPGAAVLGVGGYGWPFGLAVEDGHHHR
jgi:hypothetical protein